MGRKDSLCGPANALKPNVLIRTCLRRLVQRQGAGGAEPHGGQQPIWRTQTPSQVTAPHASSSLQLTFVLRDAKASPCPEGKNNC